MSRIGKQPIFIPDNVEVTIEGNEISAKGPKGEIFHKVHPDIDVEKKEQLIILKPKKSINSTAIWGLSRALVFNVIHGVSEGYTKRISDSNEAKADISEREQFVIDSLNHKKLPKFFECL